MSVAVRFFESDTQDEEMTQLAKRYVQTFVDAANLGAMAGDTILPAQSGLNLVASNTTSVALSWEFSQCVIDPTAVLMLVNMFHCFHAHCKPIESVVIESDLITQDLFEQLELPDFFEPLPFLINFEAEGPDVIIDLEFFNDLSATDFSIFSSAWEVWLDLASFGAFSDEIFPPDKNEIYEANDPVACFENLQFAVENAHLSSKAFDSLTNILHRLYTKVAPFISCTYS